MTSEQAIAEMREKLTEFLRRRGLRKTPERYAIMERAMRLHMHFGVDDLYNAMEAEGYHVSLATIYNTLELLCEASILNRHIFTTNQAKYELACGSHPLSRFHPGILLLDSLRTLRQLPTEGNRQAMN